MSSVYTVRVPGTGRNPWGELLGAMAQAILAQYLLRQQRKEAQAKPAVDSAAPQSGAQDQSAKWGLQPLPWTPGGAWGPTREPWTPAAPSRPVTSMASALRARPEAVPADPYQCLYTPTEEWLRWLLRQRNRSLDI